MFQGQNIQNRFEVTQQIECLGIKSGFFFNKYPTDAGHLVKILLFATAYPRIVFLPVDQSIHLLALIKNVDIATPP
jgi:hypothetical protein